jgi:TetR/AcrR family transcriptional regulator, cholesterol catabolism regulator
MAAEKKRPVSRKRAAVEEEILSVAADKFAKRGYQATPLEDIAASAGISRAAFYLYFSSKDELLQRILSRVVKTYRAGVEQIVAEDVLAPEKLRHIVRFLVRYAATNATLVQVFFNELFYGRVQARNQSRRSMRAVLKMIEQVVHAGVQKGELVAVQPAIFTYALAGMCHWIYRWYEPDGVWTPDTVADEFIRIVESGCLRHKIDSPQGSNAEELRVLQREIKDLTAMVMKLDHRNTLAPAATPRRHPHSSPASAA